MTEPLLIAKSKTQDIHLLPQLANRHGLITGATGTGKTVTLQKMAESFANIGVPVFMADVKGDLSGVGAAGVESPKLKERLAALGITGFTRGRAPRCSGTSSARPVTRCGPRCPTWARCSSPACSTSTRPSPGAASWCSRSPTTRAC